MFDRFVRGYSNFVLAFWDVLRKRIGWCTLSFLDRIVRFVSSHNLYLGVAMVGRIPDG